MISAIIVTFNPNIPLLRNNLLAVLPQVDTVVIVDNGSKNNQEIIDCVSDNRVKVLSLGNNLGIAAAQNKGMSYLEKQGAIWGLTLDQDSIIPDNMISMFKKSKHFSEENTGILAAQYNDPNWTKEQRDFKIVNNDEDVERCMVIASGNLVRVAAWKIVDGYDEWMFIDQVDFDFDARMLLSGYRIWQVNSVIMTHEVGKVIQKPFLSTILLFPKTAVFSDHSSFREYYIQRNTIIYSKRYPEFRRHKFQVLVSILQSRRILVCNGPRIRKLLAAWRGIIDGIRYHPLKDEEFQKFRDGLNNES